MKTARERLSAYREELLQLRAAEFAEKGGCTECHGRGWIVTWDTLDSLSGCYAEYGPCPQKEANPSAHGEGAPFDFSRYSKYDQLRGVEVELVQSADEAAKREALEALVEDERIMAKAAEAAATIATGKTVRVAKGRKVPVGTEGVIFWHGKGRWAERVGLKDAAGTVHWTAASNVVVI